MNNILTNYHVVMTTPLNYPFYNSIRTVNEVMTCVLEDHYLVYSANNIVNGVNNVLNNPDVNQGFIYTQSSEMAMVTKTATYFYGDADAFDDNPSIQPDYSIPTTDFLVIAQAWSDYLTNSPTTPPSPTIPNNKF